MGDCCRGKVNRIAAGRRATKFRIWHAGVWRLQRETLPGATVVLDWWYDAMRFEHALQPARSLGAGDTHLADDSSRGGTGRQCSPSSTSAPPC
jgi:hypothetical protein